MFMENTEVTFFQKHKNLDVTFDFQNVIII